MTSVVPGIKSLFRWIPESPWPTRGRATLTFLRVPVDAIHAAKSLYLVFLPRASYGI